MTTSPLVTTSRHRTTTEMTTNPTTQRSESTISRTTRPGASTLTTLPYTPTMAPTSNKTKEPPGTLGRTVNIGAAIGGSLAAVVLVAAVVGGVYFYRRKWKAESEPEWDRLHDINNDMNDMLPYQPTTQPETGHREEPFSLDGALLMEDITSMVMRDAPWGHNPALQDD
ncbi:uncharacterized protein [Branchiostoma lanceolatum]|uniref:uncharacterized protein n=1 Tax=Branchiostoma lanceolatum TaxID=7740 RepID=UPI003456C4CF